MENIDYKNIKETFLALTYHTVPHTKEKQYLGHLLPKYLKSDNHGNLYYRVGGDDTSVMFTAHLDTVGGDNKINHVIDGDYIKSDGKTIVGADDKAGVTLMIYMIEHNKKGLYYFFHGEEYGCIGSRALSREVEKTKDTNPLFKNIKMVVSLDRKGYDSVITYQTGERCCSDEFADELAKRLNSFGMSYKKDETGSLTDSIQFTEIYPECTNLSVGYFDQHANYEKQDIKFLENLATVMCKVDWETLPIVRDPSKKEYRYSGAYSGTYSGGYGGAYGGGYTSRGYSGRRGTYYDEYDDYYNHDWIDDRKKQGRREKRNKITDGKVVDWRGNSIPIKNAVWCEFDEKWCLKSEGIWEDIIGFYSIPDQVTVKEPTKTEPQKLPDNVKQVEIDNIHSLKIKDKVYHETFGKGIIYDIEKDKKIIGIIFDNGSKKSIFLPFVLDKMTILL
jgi:hypothetical protein